MTETPSKGLGPGNTKPVEELIRWFVDEYNKGRGYAKVALHPEGTLTERRGPDSAEPTFALSLVGMLVLGLALLAIAVLVL